MLRPPMLYSEPLTPIFLMHSANMDSTNNYYRLNDLYIGIELPILVDASGVQVDLEPKVWRLIILLCQNRQRVISRDEIIADVYEGTIVSDNAVNKMVAKARKVLTDSPSNSRFIKTIPKQGYSLIAEVDIVQSIDSSSPLNSTSNKVSPVIYGATLIAFVVMFFGWMLFSQSNHHQFINKKLSPLTHDAGVESAPSISPNGQYLVFQKNAPQQDLHQWWIKSLNANASQTQLPFDTVYSNVAWSSQEMAFLYVENDQGCQVKKVTIAKPNLTLSSSNIMNCDGLWLANLAYSKDELGFYYIARKSIHTPWRIYYYRFDKQESTLVSQPQSLGTGNYAFDMSPKKDKLLILSSDERNKTLLHVLNIESNELRLKGQRDWSMQRAIWHHDNQRIVHTSQRYARELLVSSLLGDVSSTLVSTSKRVSENVQRHPNGVDFYFSSFQMNNDLVRLRGDDEMLLVHNNSELYEKLPVYMVDSSNWIFVSNLNGISQIYLSSSSRNDLRQVTYFESEFEFSSLDTSPKGDRVAFHSANTLFVGKLNSSQFQQYSVPMGRIVSTRWLPNQRIAVSVVDGGRYQVLIFDLLTGDFQPISARWLALLSAKDSAQIFAVEATTNQIYQLDNNFNVLQMLPHKVADAITYSGLQVKATKSTVVYAQSRGAYTELWRYDLMSQQTKKLGRWLYLAGFDVADNEVVLSFEKNRSGDVIRTHLEEIK